MGAWLSRVRQALSGRTTARGAVRRALISAQRSRARVELQPVWHRGELAKVIEATIEQVRANDLVISQPTIDGFRHPLAMREQLRMSFLTDDGLMTGRTEAKGRIKVPSGGEQMILGYRLTIPRSLEIDSRREHERVLVIPGLILEAELHTFSQHQPIHGVVLDISEGGMKIRCRNAKGKLGNGQRVYLKVELPDPIGLRAHGPPPHRHRLSAPDRRPRPVPRAAREEATAAPSPGGVTNSRTSRGSGFRVQGLEERTVSSVSTCVNSRDHRRRLPEPRTLNPQPHSPILLHNPHPAAVGVGGAGVPCPAG